MKKYILLLFLGFIGTLHAQTKIELEVLEVHTHSNRINWCAPACAECVLKYNNIKNINQCAIMDWIRNTFNYYGGPYGFGCCVDMIPSFEHPCDKCVVLGFNDEEVSIKKVLKHFSNGTLYGASTLTMNLADITYFLNQKQPIIAQWNYWDAWRGAHTVVIYGIERVGNVDRILFMNPDGGLNIKNWYPYEFFQSNAEFYWLGSLLVCPSLPSRDCPPCHCYNGEQDEDEEGIDCGGTDCPPCPPPPPPPPPPPSECENCIKDPGEVEIDCGGVDCPPCWDVLEEIIITNTAQLRQKVMAFNKITASGATTVASGENVNFITEEEGSIVLLPGFTAERGSKFSTQRWQDLSGYSRICPENLCRNVHYLSQHHSVTSGSDFLKIYNLLYAAEIEYRIYNSEGLLIYSNALDITNNGKFELWDCVTGTVNPTGTVWYYIVYDIFYCNGTSHGGTWHFYVNYRSNKSLNEDPEDPENTTPLLSPNNENTVSQNKNAPPNFSIIPNPNNGTFQIETNFPLSEISNLKISNLIGTTIYETQHVTEQPIQLPNSALGMFFVVIILKDGAVLTQKMVVQ